MAKRKARHKSAARKGRPRSNRKTPETTVVHVDKQVYQLLRKERKPEDRGMNEPLRRLIGLAAAS